MLVPDLLGSHRKVDLVRLVRRALSLVAVLTGGLAATSCSATDSSGSMEAVKELSMDSLLTVGTIDGPEEEVFARVTEARFDEDGRLLVLFGASLETPTGACPCRGGLEPPSSPRCAWP